MNLFTEAVTTTISTIAKMLKRTTGNDDSTEERTSTPYRYHIVHKGGAKVMNQEAFDEFKRRVHNGEIAKTDYYIHDIEPAGINAQERHAKI